MQGSLTSLPKLEVYFLSTTPIKQLQQCPTSFYDSFDEEEILKLKGRCPDQVIIRFSFLTQRQTERFSSIQGLFIFFTGQISELIALSGRKIGLLNEFNAGYLLQLQLIKIQTNMFKVIENQRIQLIQIARRGNLTNQEINIVLNIYVNHNMSNKFKGCQIASLVQKPKKNNQALRVDNQIQEFKIKMKGIEYQIKALSHNALNQIINPTKNQTKVDSKIMEQDPAGLRCILQQLNNPPELKLLYRASEHSFSVEEFHRKCDNKPNTLTIAKTKHKKVIAGFTSQMWSIEDCYKSDKKLQTFVFSINLRQKYQLLEPSKAIRCKKENGPAFGITDFTVIQDTSKGYIFSLFPSNLNYKNKYQKDQLRIREILGENEKNVYAFKNGKFTRLLKSDQSINLNYSILNILIQTKEFSLDNLYSSKI